MEQNSFFTELQQIQCELSSGLKTLKQVELQLSEESPPSHCSDALYVVSAYLRDLHRRLAQCIWNYECSQGL